ncbi:MAG: thiolase family protein [Gammaproteobacteria bacterium]|nr:thiolase family protein [Gammaproteobacteria bacterium]
MLPYKEVALVAATSLPYLKRSEHSAAWFIGMTFARMLKQAGLQKHQVDGLAIASFTLAPDSVVSMTEYLDISPRWLEQIPMGGASGPVAARRAARAVQAGDADIVACIGADTATADTFTHLLQNFSRFATDAVYPYGAGGPNTVFAMITRHYMEQFGAQREDFGRICVAQRENALAAGRAIFNKPLTLAAYLEARPISEPLHLYDCVMPVAGADGFLVMSVAQAEALELPYARLLSAGERHNAWAEDPVHVRGGWSCYRDELYEQAGLGPADIDLLQTYDDYPVIAMIQMEDLGFCEKGAGPEFVRSQTLTWNGGGLAHNTCGGQLSAGQAGAAGGFLGAVEAIRQLTETGLPNQVPGANTGLVSGYGMVNYDRCLCTSAMILGRGGQ